MFTLGIQVCLDPQGYDCLRIIRVHCWGCWTGFFWSILNGLSITKGMQEGVIVLLKVDRIWVIWGSYYSMPKAIFYLLVFKIP